MKKILILSIFLVLLVSLNSEDYNIYDLELVAKILNGSGIGEIDAWVNAISDESPSGFVSDKFGNLWISDSQKQQILIFSDMGEYIRSEDYPMATWGVDLIYNQIPFIVRDNSITLSYNYGEKYVNLGFFSNRRNLMSPVFYQMNSFFYDEEGNIYCIPDPGPDYSDFNSKNAKLFKNEEVVALFKADSGVDMKGMSIDEDYNLFDSEGKLVVRDYERYIAYWENIHVISHLNPPSNYFNVSFDISKVKGLQYIGEDRNGNTYWFSNMYFYILSNEGWMIDLIKIDYSKSKTRPAVHPNGDIYLLDYDTEWVYLYKIPNTWDPFYWTPPAQDFNP